MLLVAGATGSLGFEICRQLRERGEAVRGLVRPTSKPEKIHQLTNLGVELAWGDLTDNDSLSAACRGVTNVVTTVATTLSRQPTDTIERVDLHGQIELIEAARSAGAQHFTYVSVSGGLPSTIPFVAARRRVEDHLRRSGFRYVILRPSAFMEIWLAAALGFDPLGGRVRVFGSGTAPVSYVSLIDVAAFAAGLIGHQTFNGDAVELGGPEALSPLDVVKICEQECGRPIHVDCVPEEALEQQIATSSDEYEWTLAALALTLARSGNAVHMCEALRPDGRRLTSVRDYAARAFRHASAASA